MGKTKTTIFDLHKKMEELVLEENFEMAARYRDMIKAEWVRLAPILIKKNPKLTRRDVDIIKNSFELYEKYLME